MKTASPRRRQWKASNRLVDAEVVETGHLGIGNLVEFRLGRRIDPLQRRIHRQLGGAFDFAGVSLREQRREIVVGAHQALGGGRARGTPSLELLPGADLTRTVSANSGHPAMV